MTGNRFQRLLLILHCFSFHSKHSCNDFVEFYLKLHFTMLDFRVFSIFNFVLEYFMDHFEYFMNQLSKILVYQLACQCFMNYFFLDYKKDYQDCLVLTKFMSYFLVKLINDCCITIRDKVNQFFTHYSLIKFDVNYYCIFNRMINL